LTTMRASNTGVPTLLHRAPSIISAHHILYHAGATVTIPG